MDAGDGRGRRLFLSPAIRLGGLPLRFVAGADAMAAVEANLLSSQDQIDVQRNLPASLSFGDASIA